MAGDGCSFSHDPSAAVGSLSANNGNSLNISGSPGSNNSFPALHSPGLEQWPSPSQGRYPGQVGMQGGSPYRMGSPSNGANMRGKNAGMNQSGHRFPQTNSRPSSRLQNRGLNSSLSVDDPDAFPTLSSTNNKAPSRKSQTKKNQPKENVSSPLSSLKISSSPTPSPRRPASKPTNYQNGRVLNISPEKASASAAIPTPKNVPWFDDDPRFKQYIRYRRDGIALWNERTGFFQT